MYTGHNMKFIFKISAMVFDLGWEFWISGLFLPLKGKQLFFLKILVETANPIWPSCHKTPKLFFIANSLDHNLVITVDYKI